MFRFWTNLYWYSSKLLLVVYEQPVVFLGLFEMYVNKQISCYMNSSVLRLLGKKDESQM